MCWLFTKHDYEYIERHNSHRVNFGFVSEYHIILKLVTTTRPKSPPLPLVSSMESIMSKIRSPLCSFLWLYVRIYKNESRERLFSICACLHHHHVSQWNWCLWAQITYMLGTSNLISLSSHTLLYPPPSDDDAISYKLVLYKGN